jgi:predicted transcriptional regulator
MAISIPQLRAARAMVGLTLSDIHERTGISTGAVSAIETGKADPRLSTVLKLQTLFEELGVEFLPEGDHFGPGVRLKRRSGQP